ncbi:hypothetical protein ACFL5L_06775, partial [candidate division KSB1 bacterium]
LKADIIIVDLGAGISNNTLDFFNLSSRGIVVTNPEPNATQDAYFFLKNVLYRRMRLFAKINEPIKRAFDDYIDRNGNGMFDFGGFREFLNRHQQGARKEYNNFLNEFNPRLIVNKIRSIRQNGEGTWFINLVKTFLDIEMEYLGGLRFDKRITQSSEKLFPFIYHFPNARITKGLFSILSNLNGIDLPRHEIRTFKQFRTLLKEQQKQWH